MFSGLLACVGYCPTKYFYVHARFVTLALAAYCPGEWARLSSVLVPYGTPRAHDERMRSVVSAERAYWTDDGQVHHQEESNAAEGYSTMFLAVDFSIINIHITSSQDALWPRHRA